MNATWRLLIVRITRRLWFRSALYGAFGVASALIGAVAKPLIPPGVAAQIGAAAVGNILGILASSMLAVTTFSLSTMVAAYAAASSNATPRASTLLIEDSGSQSALASFIGAFLFSIVGLIALSTGVYGDSGRLILFAATIMIIVMIVVTLLRWIDQISRLGRVGETIDRVERATREAMKPLARAPWLHASPHGELPADAIGIFSRRIGYITYIDVERLQRLADSGDIQLWTGVAAGSFITPDQVIARLSKPVDEELAAKIADAFVVDDLRDFDQDPRFGLVVLTEIAQRALSPAINDPGTAIDIIGTVTRLLCEWAEARQTTPAEELRYPRVHVRALDEGDFFEDVYAPLVRDSAGLLEVAIRLHKSLATLGQLGYAPYRAAALAQTGRALQFSAKRLSLDSDQQRLLDIAGWRGGSR
ncbi:DUF2254 domain-containing protein [Rhodanobacter ginsengisoli]|uniref:DUF2254 domain-containing protein n=1 Tax=Rhodanobacter ginsengisoli TaxID=418646 RepID=A0ABW0QN86_9GAMM